MLSSFSDVASRCYGRTASKQPAHRALRPPCSLRPTGRLSLPQARASLPLATLSSRVVFPSALCDWAFPFPASFQLRKPALEGTDPNRILASFAHSFDTYSIPIMPQTLKSTVLSKVLPVCALAGLQFCRGRETIKYSHSCTIITVTSVGRRGTGHPESLHLGRFEGDGNPEEQP